MSDLRRVLVVDDNETNRMLAKALLSRLGWTVEEADCGEIALQKVATIDYSVVLLDISMPGLSGEDTCVEIRKMGKPLRIIAYTAHAFPEERAKFLAIGFDDILVKPINRQQLEELINKV
jgi:CheY-like chemotaxis protein